MISEAEVEIYLKVLLKWSWVVVDVKAGWKPRFLWACFSCLTSCWAVWHIDVCETGTSTWCFEMQDKRALRFCSNERHTGSIKPDRVKQNPIWLCRLLTLRNSLSFTSILNTFENNSRWIFFLNVLLGYFHPSTHHKLITKRNTGSQNAVPWPIIKLCVWL